MSDYKVVHHDERILAITLSIDCIDITIINVYGPSVDRERQFFFQTIDEITAKMPKDAGISIAANFNIVSSNELDIIAGNKHQECAVEKFNNCMFQWEVFDILGLFHGDEKEYTWCRFNPFIARRLNHILCNMSLFNNTVVCDIITIPGTDHRGVTVEFQLTDVSRGPPYWKFNENLLKNAAYLDLINHVIDEHIVSSHLSDPRVTWDMC